MVFLGLGHCVSGSWPSTGACEYDQLLAVQQAPWWVGLLSDLLSGWAWVCLGAEGCMAVQLSCHLADSWIR